MAAGDGSPETPVTEARTEVMRIAAGIIEGAVEPVAGCRAINRLVAGAGLSTAGPVAVFRAVEAETDDLPLGGVRAGYSLDLLERLDRSVIAYLEAVRPTLLDACAEIVRELGQH
jgi:hypothetical protein